MIRFHDCPHYLNHVAITYSIPKCKQKLVNKSYCTWFRICTRYINLC